MIKKEKLEAIRYILHTKYHQDVWEDFSTHEDVWNWMLTHEPKEETLLPLMNDVSEMLTWTDKDIHDFIYGEECGGLRLDTPEAARAWLEKLHRFLEEHKQD